MELDYILYVLLIAIVGLFPCYSASQQDVSNQTLYECPYPDSLNKSQHDKFLDGLNRTKIVFLGDSVTRCCTLAAYPWMTVLCLQHQQFASPCVHDCYSALIIVKSVLYKVVNKLKDI